jgi:hypothetical protein
MPEPIYTETRCLIGKLEHNAMDEEQSPASSRRLASLAKKFQDKQYRDGYVASHTRRVLADQMRNFRGSLPQTEYAAKIDKQKTAVGRLENPAYGGWSLRAMLEVARKENVAVLCRFVDIPTFLKLSDDLSKRPCTQRHMTLTPVLGTDGGIMKTKPYTVRGVDIYGKPLTETIDVPVYRFPRLHRAWGRLKAKLGFGRFKTISGIRMIGDDDDDED